MGGWGGVALVLSLTLEFFTGILMILRVFRGLVSVELYLNPLDGVVNGCVVTK